MSRKYNISTRDLLKKYKEIATLVKKIVKKIDPDAKVYVFGSVVKGKFTGGSDIDILIVSEKVDKKHEIAVAVYKNIEAPIELHIVTEKVLKNWYLRFIKLDELQEI